jgi:hypothetical protein
VTTSVSRGIDHDSKPDPEDADRPAAVIHGEAVPRRVTVEAFAQDGEALLYSADRDEASALNRTATEVWELCDGRLTVREIAGALGNHYGVPGELLFDDVASVVVALRRRGLVELLDPPAAS